jgi:hypothetical protein
MADMAPRQRKVRTTRVCDVFVSGQARIDFSTFFNDVSTKGTAMSIGRNHVHAVTDAPVLQWANGKSFYRETLGAGRFVAFVGWHSEAGRDDDLDRAMLAAKMPQIEIKHQRPGGAEIVRHWSLGCDLVFHPITSGPVAPTVAGSCAERNAAATADAGLGLRWGAGERSRMAVRGFIAPLLAVGCLRLVQLSVRSRMTDVLLSCLLDHGRVCAAADDLIDRAKHPELVTFHEVGLPLGPGQETEWGKGDTATVVPFASAHPAQVDADYLRRRWRSTELHAAAYAAWGDVQLWAADYAVDEPGAGDEAGGGGFGR